MKLSEDKTHALARASFTGNLTMVQMLVEHGANVDIPTENGNTAAMWAAFVGNAAVLAFLISQKAILTTFNRDGECQLME